MIFKDKQESATLLAQKIKEELGDNLSSSLFAYIDPDDKNYCELITNQLNQKLIFLPDILPDTKYLLILDSGNTHGQEYNEFTDRIRKNYPETQIFLAIPVIPQSEENILKASCDGLITLHIDPLFFSIDQFYISK